MIAAQEAEHWGGGVLFDRGNPIESELCGARKDNSRKKTPETEARKRECVRMHVVLNYGVSAISKRLKMNKALVRKWLVSQGVYKIGGRCCKPIEAAKGPRFSQWIFDYEWRGVKQWEDCKHWFRHPEYLRQRNNATVARTYHRHKAAKTNYHIGRVIRSRIISVIKGKKKSARTVELLGCSIEHLRSHLQGMFKKGMNWNNHGEWEIDHIMPCASFDMSKPEHQRLCFHYTNLQPLWKRDNRVKHDAIRTHQPLLCM